jgi:hypothetical protein
LFAVVSVKGFFGVDHSFDTVVHILNQVLLRASESSLVGDIVGGVGGLGVLSVNTADLDVVLVGDGLEGSHVLRKLGELDMDGGSHGSTKVGGA